MAASLRKPHGREACCEAVQTRFQGKAWVFGDSIDTDMITPGKYLAILDPKGLAEHVLEGADPSFAKKVQPGDLLVAGQNFGCGSSREHAPVAIKGAGIPVVVAESFARIFYRNAINIGLPVLEVPGVHALAQEGDTLEVDLTKGTVRNARTGKTLQGAPLSAKAVGILEAGGLVNVVRQKLHAKGPAQHEAQRLPNHADHKTD
jgi:3-isopropylmalate/(R)-2-methylmalate dehydratase small subunit